MVSKFHNGIHDHKEQVHTIYTIVKGSKTYYRRHTVTLTSCSEVEGYHLTAKIHQGTECRVYKFSGSDYPDSHSGGFV